MSRDDVRINLRSWEADSDHYQSEHVAQLNRWDAFGWGTWDVPEDEIHALGDVTGLRALELGCGAAQTGIKVSMRRAHVTGIDFSENQLRHARENIAETGTDMPLVRASAEELPFADGSFDLVYSWGVIHHAAHPHRIVREVRRLLAPGGEARVMLYGRQSWAAYKLWLRHALLVGRPRRTLSEVIGRHLESPGTRAYTRREIELLFAGAGFEHVAVAGFPTPYDRRAAGPLAARIRLDWFLGVVAS